MTDAPAVKLSPVEGMKIQSKALRGTIAADLADTSKACLDETGYQLLKFHGIYEGFNRDTATARKQQGLDKEYEYMTRIAIPGGRLTADQYLRLDELADSHANGTLRVTTRQAIQYHCITKGNLKDAIAEIRLIALTTLSACGDVVRNITSNPAPINDTRHRVCRETTDLLARELTPRTKAYAEIWVKGEPVLTDEEVVEPLYGKTYLPRKFKIGVGFPEDNSVDLLTNDLAVLALFEGDTLKGFNLALGGGLGMTHNKAATYPRLATPLVFVEPENLVRGVKAVVTMQRDYGDRTDRKHARLKYLVQEKGNAWVLEKLAEHYGEAMQPARPMPAFVVVDHMGWHEQGDGKWYFGLPLSSGRIKDVPGGAQWRTALREVVQQFKVDPVLTPNQDILLTNIAPVDRAKVEALLRQYQVPFASDQSVVSRWAMACPALPTCGLALTEAERVKEPMIASIEAAMQPYGLQNQNISIRITGCPNGCARPYAGEIGLVGRMPGFYALYLGGDFEGTRLNVKVLDKLAEDKIAPTLGKVFGAYDTGKKAQESFADFCQRLGAEALKVVCEA
jgi:sulfite reductase (ferredoxin)